MKNRTHLDEQILNMYLDGELSAAEHDSAEAHLGTCEACRGELQALQELFVALEEIELDPMPAPGLAPGVLVRVRPCRRALSLRWLIPALQGAAALALLAWGWTRLVSYWTSAISVLPSEALDGTWGRAAEWLLAQWATFNTLPTTAWAGAKSWIARPHLFGSPGFSLPQIAVTGAILGMVWLACNMTLLQRTIGNGGKTRSN